VAIAESVLVGARRAG